MKKNGFTLIEIMIVVAILATLSIFTAQSIRQALTAKEKIQVDVDQFSTVRDALRLMERDINLAFHYRDIEKEVLLKSMTAKKNNTNQRQQPASGEAAPETDESTNPEEANSLATGSTGNATLDKKFKNRLDPRTDFLGQSDKFNFVTMNGAIQMKNSRMADFQEVGYETKSCKSLDTGKSSNCLWRRTSSIVDDDPSLGGEEMALLEDVTEFKLRYMGKGKQDWVSSWDSTQKGGDDITKNRFPDAVEISLTTEPQIKNKKSKKISMQLIVPIHFSNNGEIKK